MNATQRTEQWRGYVSEQVPAALVPFVLGIIKNESGGQPGIEATRETRLAADLPSRNGGQVTSKNALGLMQVIPTVIADYNAQAVKPVFYEDMIGQSIHAGQRQIDVGLWTLNNVVVILENETGRRLVTNDQLDYDLLSLALASYAWGIGRIKNKLQELKAAGLTPNYSNLVARYPNLGLPENQPLVYVDRIFRNADNLSKDNLLNTVKQTAPGLLAAVVTIGGIAYAANWFLEE